ncbi:MAG: DUF1727 domain-containing protein, partial [bacterium]|nr:DUF1727 domain-containing protein [bacterium]
YAGHKVLIQLIKNPVGATEVLKTVDLNSNILLAVNSNEADGQDISWINDAEFEILRGAKKEIVVSGVRAKEMAERLEKAGCKNYKIVNDVKDAVAYISKVSDNDITMLPNYTAYMTISKMKGFKKCC